MHDHLVDAPPARSAGRGRLLAALLVIGCAIIGAGVGAWWGMRQQAVHPASAVVLVNPLEGNPFNPTGRGDELVNLETEAQLVRSDDMGTRVGEVLDADPQELLAEVSVTALTNTQLLEITARDDTAAGATARAQAFAETYLTFRTARAEAARSARATELRARIREREAEQERLGAQLGRLEPRSSRAAVLTQQIVNLSVQTDELHAELGATGGIAPDPGQVVTPAVAGRAGLPGGLVTTVLVGALAGAALGWVGGSGAGRDRRDLGEQGGPPAGGGVPGSDPTAWPAPLLGTLPSTAPASALNAVRAALLAAERTRPLTVLLCHPPAAYGSVGAVGLARSLAAAHLRTVLVDVSRPLGPPGRGLADVLRDEAALADVVMHEGPALRMVGAGSRPSVLDDALASPRAAEVVDGLRAEADVVLLCGGTAGGPRSQALAAVADTVLLEVQAGVHDAAATAAAAEQLRRVGARSVRLLVVEGETPVPPDAAVPGAPATPATTTAPAAPAVLAEGEDAVPVPSPLHARPRLRLRLSRWVLG